MVQLFVVGIDSEEKVLERREEALEWLHTGKVDSWSDENVTVHTKIIMDDPVGYINMCNEFLLTLKGKRITRTTPTYSQL